MDDWLERLAPLIEASGGDVLGATEADVSALEQQSGVLFPATYRAFLLRYGRAAGRLFDRDEMDVFVDQLEGLTARIAEILREEGRTLPERAFVIRSRYGEQFEFIVCDRTDDAPVLYGADWEPVFDVAYASVPEWLERICDDELGETQRAGTD